MWSLGQSTEASKALLRLLLTFVPPFVLVASSRFRNTPDLTRLDVLVDVVTAVGLGLLAVTVVLVILQRGTLSTPLTTAVKMAVFEAAPFAIAMALLGDRPIGAAAPSRRRRHALCVGHSLAVEDVGENSDR